MPSPAIPGFAFILKGLKMTKEQIQSEALARATNPLGSWSNFGTIINGFSAKGIPVDTILPRENVFTFNAWKALGRYVRKGEHGIKVCTFRQDQVEEQKSDGTKETKNVSRPWFATVFHISQTDPIAQSQVA